MTTQEKPTLTRKGQRTRGQLVDAAVALAARSGLEALNVSAICAEAGLPRSTFYTYFDDVGPVVETVGAVTAEAFASRFDAAEAGAPRGLARLERCLKAVLSLAETDPALARLAVSLDRSGHALRARLEDEMARELEGAGQPPGVRPALIAGTLIAQLDDALQGRSAGPAKDIVPLLMRLCAPGSEPR